MSEWKKSFSNGVASFRAQKLEEALAHFSEAVQAGASDALVFDSRAAVYERLGRPKDALRDSKVVIDMNPDRWQGYARSARLFLKLDKFHAAGKMVDMAIERIPPGDTRRREELSALRGDIRSGCDIAAEKERQRASRTFYHFGKLPVEIATIIFSLVVQEKHWAVIPLSQVCRDWRTTALSTPSLWSTLSLFTRNPVRKAKTWKARVKGMLETLTVSGDHLRALETLQDVPLDRLRSLEMHHINLNDLQRLLPSLSHTVLCNLGSIVLHDSQPHSGATWLWKHFYPRLRKLSVEGNNFDWPSLARSCTNLREFHYNGTMARPNQSDFLYLLYMNKSLERLTSSISVLPFSRNKYEPIAWEIPASIQLPHLSHLEFAVNTSDDVHLLTRLELPSLKSLSITRSPFPLDINLCHLANSAFASSLLELKLHTCPVSPAVLIQVLHVAVSLENLELRSIGDIKGVVEALAEPAEGGVVLCPKLTHVNLSKSSGFQSGSLIRLVKHRLPADPERSNVSPITSLIVDNCSTIDSDILPWLRSKVPVFSCVYQTKKEARRTR